MICEFLEMYGIKKSDRKRTNLSLIPYLLAAHLFLYSFIHVLFIEGLFQ